MQSAAALPRNNYAAAAIAPFCGFSQSGASCRLRHFIPRAGHCPQRVFLSDGAHPMIRSGGMTEIAAIPF